MLTMRMGAVQGPAMETWQFTVNTEATTSGAKTSSVPISLYNQSDAVVIVDWGDGTSSTLTSSDYSQTNTTASVHEYAAPGVYTISVSSAYWAKKYILLGCGTSYSNFNIASVTNTNSAVYWWRNTLISLDNALPPARGMRRYSSGTSTSLSTTTGISSLFVLCTELTTIFSGLFSNISTIAFTYCFYGCSSLASIPSGLFDSNTAVTDFSYCFYGCSSLTSIPSGLFDNNTAVTSFSYCFRGCSSVASIPSGLFDNNTAVTDFSRCFYGCSHITSIPSGLFDSNTAATNFSYCFRDCSALVTIPSGLFSNNTAVTNFSYCFRDCSSLGSFTIHIGSTKVSSGSAVNFVTKKNGVTRTVYVPSGSTTQTTFNSVASSLGLTVIGE